MKPVSAGVLLGLAFVLAAPHVARAQAMGAKAGLTLVKINTEPADDFGFKATAQPGVQGGVFVTFRQDARLSLQIDGLISMKRMSFDVSDVELTTFDVPVAVRWPVAKGSAYLVRVVGGVTTSILVRARERAAGNDPFDIKAAFKTVTASAFVGGQLEWNERWLFDGRYSFGVTEIYSEPVAGFTSRQRGVELTVGYRWQ